MGWFKQLPAHVLWTLFALVFGQTMLAVMRVAGFDPAIWIEQRLRIRRRHRRWADVIRWALVSLVVLLAIAILYSGEWLLAYMGPHEGSPAAPPFQVLAYRFIEHGSPVPGPGVNQFIRITEPFSGCYRNLFDAYKDYLTTTQIAARFHPLIASVDAYSDKECFAYHNEVGATAFSTAFLDSGVIMSDAQMQEIKDSARIGYAFFVWKYRLDSDPKATYIAVNCAMFFGDLRTKHQCEGDFDRAFRHLEK